MLIHVLRNVGYNPVPEQAVFEFERCKREDVDIDGWYNPDERKVYICEPLIIETVEKTVSNIIPGPKLEMYFIYRERVRLHEHIHAYIHQRTGDFWYRKCGEISDRIKRDIEEPITEFLSYCVIKNYLGKDLCYGKKFLKLFEELPRIRPYDQWKDILSMCIKIAPNQDVKIDDLCKQIEKDDNLLKIIFRIFIDIIRTKPKSLNVVKDRLKKYYPRSILIWSLEKV